MVKWASTGHSPVSSQSGRSRSRKKHTVGCVCERIQTFKFDSADTGVTSHFISGFAVIVPYVRGFQIKDVETRVKIFGGDLKFLAASNLLSIFDPHYFKGGRSGNFTLEDHVRTFQGSDRSRLLGKHRRCYQEKRG